MNFTPEESSKLYAKLNAADPFFVFAGPCVVESEEHAFVMAQRVKEIGEKVGIPIV
jgi:2-dehydro-3-deoxyphosphooctonate aldolase (KDO 8-P synthase)